jgi:hypothetical protein
MIEFERIALHKAFNSMHLTVARENAAAKRFYQNSAGRNSARLSKEKFMEKRL